MNPDLPLNRLAREYQRLFVSTQPPKPGGEVCARALVLGVTGPSAWQALAAAWRGAQTDLELPAAAIAVNGTDGLQLWFSLADAVEAARGLAVLDGLRRRYLRDVPLHRVTMQVEPEPAGIPKVVSGCASRESRWSAFVAADLAPIFEETPWLDMQPTDDGQAELLSRVSSITPAELQTALQRLQVPEPSVSDRAPASVPAGGDAHVSAAAVQAFHPEAAAFLLQLMRDADAPLALRVEAAKALLPYAP